MPNPNLICRWFIVPGFSGILAFFSALLITSLLIARERELGTFDHLLVSPASTPEIIMPTLMQWPAQAIPLTHFLIIVQGSFLKALPLRDILASLWPLAIIALVALAVAAGSRTGL